MNVQTAQSERSSRAWGKSASHNNRVAIVDDDELVLRALSVVLGSAGFETSCFRNAEQALTSIEAAAPAVIVSDYLMPGMDGVAFLKLVRGMAPHAVRILCTAAGDLEVALEAVNSAEVFRIILKPWRQRELVATVRQAAEVSEAAELRGENERLVGQLREMNLKLEGLVVHRTQALLKGLTAALDSRDTVTQWHSRRVSIFARRLGQQLGLAEPELTVIEHGALLHDIGKIGVRDQVLLKPGPLSPDEWAEMRRHPEAGWALLQQVDYLRPASLIVLHHHEKWDGSGYPKGLPGEQIVIGARIFAVVDTLDAMTSDRPYRLARPYGEARAEIIRFRGTQFDPAVVDAFLTVGEEEWQRIRTDVETGAAPRGEGLAREGACTVP